MFMSDKNMDGYFQIQNRRYIGSKARLTDWIFSILEQNCSGESFLDLFAGTGVVGAKAFEHYSKVSLNDFLDSNYIIYQAFIGSGEYDFDKLENLKN
jgi:adenine-specific DNA-methyltransferase